MFSDDVKAEAIDRLSGGKPFVMTGGDLGSIIFPEHPEFPAIPIARLEAMCEEVQREMDIKAKHAPPPIPSIQDQLEYLWQDIHNNSLNKEGTFYRVMMPHFDK